MKCRELEVYIYFPVFYRMFLNVILKCNLYTDVTFISVNNAILISTFCIQIFQKMKNKLNVSFNL